MGHDPELVPGGEEEPLSEPGVPVPADACSTDGVSLSRSIATNDVSHVGPWLAITVGKLGTAIQLVTAHAYLKYWLPQARIFSPRALIFSLMGLGCRCRDLWVCMFVDSKSQRVAGLGLGCQTALCCWSLVIRVPCHLV